MIPNPKTSLLLPLSPTPPPWPLPPLSLCTPNPPQAMEFARVMGVDLDMSTSRSLHLSLEAALETAGQDVRTVGSDAHRTHTPTRP